MIMRNVRCGVFHTLRGESDDDLLRNRIRRYLARLDIASNPVLNIRDLSTRSYYPTFPEIVANRRRLLQHHLKTFSTVCPSRELH